MHRLLASLLTGCLVVTGLLSFATVGEHSDMHVGGDACIASTVQGSACMPDAAANPLAFLGFHLQAVQQLGDGTIVTTALLGLAFVLTLTLAATPAPPAGQTAGSNLPSGEQPPPHVRRLLARWLALHEKRDPVLAA